MSNPPSSEETQKIKKKVTPLPKMKMIAVAATLLTESICTTMLLPFVGLFVAHLQKISVEEAGYSSGVLIGLFMLGQVISCKLWGWLSDMYGRRPPLLSGLFAGAWSMLFFGMAPNIYICCLMRFIHGFFNGNVLIAKIIISDITDETNAPLGFSMIGLLWTVGALIGPAIGGFLYDPLINPKLQWLHVQEGSYLARNPAFLASFVLFIYTLCSFLLCAVLVPESNLNRTKSLRNVPVLGHIINIIRPKAVTIVETTDTATSEKNEVVPSAPKPVPMTYKRAFNDPLIFTITVLVMCLCATDMTFTEILPLWAIAPADVGGLAMFSDRVGIIMLCFSIPTFVTNLVFPTLYRKVNNSKVMWTGCAILFIASSVLTPFAATLSPGAAFWFVLLTGSGKNSACSAGFTIVQMLTGKAAPPGTVGAVYGISQSFGASVRCVVPFVVAPLFAWSLSGHHSFPFNHYFVFFLSTVPLFFAIYLTWRNEIERSEEEIANAEEWDQPDGAEKESVNEYRSLANSFCTSQGDNAFSRFADMEAENSKQILIRDWMRRVGPRGRGVEMQTAIKTLKHEDCRLVSDEDLNEIEQ